MGSSLAAMGFGANRIATAAPDLESSQRSHKDRAVIYVFLSGGLGQQDSFDMKPDAPVETRGEFDPIATNTPGLQICEHLPELAKRSEKWSLVRSLTHPFNEHSQGHMAMLSGHSDLPTGFDPSKPKPTDHPSISAILGALLPDVSSLPPSITLPEKLIHRTGRVIPGQFAGVMGARRDPYFLAASRFNAQTYGAWPEYGFHHQRGSENDKSLQYMTPNLKSPLGVSETRVERRLDLLRQFEEAPQSLDAFTETESIGRYRERAISLLSDKRMRSLFDVRSADTKELDRYGRNTFGWSLLLAKRLITEGVQFVQVNLGNNETWDTHGNAFPNLKNYLFPPFDRSLSALLDDLDEQGRLENTLIVVAGEFGRTPKVFRIASAYALPGRDHWGAVQSVMLAGGPFKNGNVVGSSDHEGGQPKDSPQRPENLAATIYDFLGYHSSSVWHDLNDRPMPLINADPIRV